MTNTDKAGNPADKTQNSYAGAAFSDAFFPSLLLWYRENRRDLPWRDTGNPEDVWISEIMLQQTRVEAVKEYFIRFRKELPDVYALASCPEDRLMKLWEGLGYYSRARNLKKCAEVLVRDCGGRLPADRDALLKLPGIGPYTAGAIAAIAFGIPFAAVDGNVLRVWSRIQNRADNIALDATKQSFGREIEELLLKETGDGSLSPVSESSEKGDREPSPVSRSAVSDFTQALMELGAVVCVPNGAPLCGRCPVRAFCMAFREGTALSLPVKSAKKPRRVEERTILVLRDGERFYLRKRPARGLLAGLYEFPGFPGFLTPEEAVRAARTLGADPVRVKELPEGKHIFTHVEWRMKAYEVTVSAFPASPAVPEEQENGALPLTREELRSFAVPSAFRTWTDWYSLKA